MKKNIFNYLIISVLAISLIIGCKSPGTPTDPSTQGDGKDPSTGGIKQYLNHLYHTVSILLLDY